MVPYLAEDQNHYDEIVQKCEPYRQVVAEGDEELKLSLGEVSVVEAVRLRHGVGDTVTLEEEGP